MNKEDVENSQCTSNTGILMECQYTYRTSEKFCFNLYHNRQLLLFDGCYAFYSLSPLKDDHFPVILLSFSSIFNIQIDWLGRYKCRIRRSSFYIIRWLIYVFDCYSLLLLIRFISGKRLLFTPYVWYCYNCFHCFTKQMASNFTSFLFQSTFRCVMV